jgi:hypothetical protein
MWDFKALTIDHKPEDPKELNRIKGHNGRVEPYKNQFGEFVGPPRVWLKRFPYPGLAMSRSLGDKIARKAGVISKP